MKQDLLYAIRTLRKNPAFSVTAVLTLALGIGANTAIFTVIRAVLLKPLEYRDPERLVRLSGGATSVRYEEMRTAARSYSAIGAFRAGTENVTLSGAGMPEVLKQARVSANFLEILGVEPMMGRSFLPSEDTPAGPPVAMISADLWQRRFGANPSILGASAALGATDYTIIGVLRKGFQFPFPDVDVWVTQPYYLVTPQSPLLQVFGRLKPDSTIEQATAELTVLNRQYRAAHPAMLDAKPNSTEHVTELKDRLVANIRTTLWMLFGAVGFVLLIACANVASLLLSRAAARSREFAIRVALGAARGRLIGQLLTESLLLAFAAGILGVFLAWWSLAGIAHMTALNIPRVSEIRLDGVVLGFALALSLVTGIVFGLVPSLNASRPDLTGALRASGEAVNATASKPAMFRFSSRGVLVAAQVALSVILLTGAALLMESLLRVYGVNPGFDPTHLLTMQISLSPTRYDTEPKRAAFYEDLVRRVESLPGVRSAAVVLSLPLTSFPMTPVQPANEAPLKLNERLLAVIETATPAYFRTMQIPLKRGREFTARDKLGAPLVVVINETLARRFWPAYPNGQDPVGQRVLIGIKPDPITIVGIVADVHESREQDARPGMFRPCAQLPIASTMFAVKVEGDPLPFANSVRAQVSAIDRDQAVSGVRTMEDLVEEEVGQRRAIVVLLGIFAGVALLLTLIGIYGMIAYWVVQRTKEFGIRRALGAPRRNILWLVVGQALTLVLGGEAIGIAAALALARVLKAFLFGVSPSDPATIAGIGLLLALLALIAAYIPARRATELDPMEALRL